MVLGAIVVFLLPGMIWGELLRFSSSHFLETIALSFALTLTIEILLLPIPFIFGSKITLWIILLLAVCIVGMFILSFQRRRQGEIELTFLNPLFNFFKQPRLLNVSNTLIFLIILVMSYGTYRWGESLTNISGEKLLHVAFVRYYFSMPMIINDLGIHQGVPPGNLIHLWEYLLAGWASLTNTDPLPLFYRARFVIPILGLSGMYLLIRNIFPKASKAEIIFWGVLLMCLGWLALLSPSNLDWVKKDPFRGVFAFMGTVHHSDAAMDILIALTAGLILATFSNVCRRNIFLLSGTLLACFMWHPREFFQAAIYAGIFGITIVLSLGRERKAAIKKWVAIMAIFFNWKLKKYP
jgi:hypothetical protein